MNTTPAILALADGTIFYGKSIGAPGQTVGEVVFHTAMAGYQETLSSPAYTQQLVCFSYPHIGNAGCNDEDNESRHEHAAGLIIRDLPILHANFRATSSLSEYLQKKNIVAIADIDTRQLIRHIRDHGAQAGCIVSGGQIDEAQAIAQAKQFASLAGKNLLEQITCDEPYVWTSRQWRLNQGYEDQEALPHHVVALDFGVNFSSLRQLAERGCRVTVVPAHTEAQKILDMNPDGVYLSDGAGDPAACPEAVAQIRELLRLRPSLPIFAQGLGFQLLGLALGGSSEKLAHGYHGSNHPVKDLNTQSILIMHTHQNFALGDTFGSDVKVTHQSLFNQSVHGIELKERAVFGVEGSGSDIFVDRFIQSLPHSHA